MKIKRFSAAGLRGFEQVEFDFDESLTLLVGVNGVGKSTILEALRVSLSRILPKFTASKNRPDSFATEDIRNSATALSLDLQFAVEGRDHQLRLHKPREQFVEATPGSVRNQVRLTPDQESFSPPLAKASKKRKTADTQPLGLFFSTRRSLPSEEQPKKSQTAGGQAAAFADALSISRPLRTAEMAAWMLAQKELANELPRAGMHLEALWNAALRFMPSCSGVWAEAGDTPQLLVEKSGVTLEMKQLSDGERGMFAIVLDLARRLSQANPGLDDPVANGLGVVMIDELDMHMHPLWQREIGKLLTSTFPNCQFIVTTHSPQIIGQSPAESVILLRKSESKIEAERCGQAYGLDTNYILKHIMDTPERANDVQTLIDQVESFLDEGELTAARSTLKDIKGRIHGEDPTVVRLEATINNLKALADEAD